MTYQPPTTDVSFVLHHLIDVCGLTALDAFDEIDADTVDGLIDEAGRFAKEQLAPLNWPGDRQGVKVDGAEVTVADGFADAYELFVEAGWNGIAFDQAYGGGGLPWTLGLAVQEFINAANMSFALCPLLTQGAVDMLSHHASEEQKETYLHKLVSGEWTGTMNLTEPHAGSDVGALTTKAVPAGDGSYRITGTKIFITFGEHDMADNIVHLVLARTPDAPAGTKGISCFIVPKFLVNDDGSLGERNDLRVVSTEHKIGIHASPTCVMSYGDEGGAVGYLIGEENQGMRYMFTMMNNARLSVGLQGLALADAALQRAAQYSRERKQGRAIGAQEPSSYIVDHADVRRMLMTMRANVEAMRGVMYLNGAAMDLANAAATEEERLAADARSAVLTPLSKGWGTDIGLEMTSLGVQVHGGMGFVEETGAAQLWRDARILPIYEGTNGIQGLDLVMRKLPMGGGAAVGSLLAEMDATVAETATELPVVSERLAAAVADVRTVIAWFTEHSASPNALASGATPFLRLFGIVAGGWALARQAVTARRLLASGDSAFGEDFLADKVATATFYAEQLLPGTAGLVGPCTAGDDLMFAIGADRL